jgi:pyruvate dehydrogenase E2 component (dihydrolipoamide acetyltransferase)
VATLIEVRVPDLGDFEDVPVIEVLVGPGDAVAVEDPLIVLESDKATMEVPAPSAGTVGQVAVKVDDTVSQGDLILTLSTEGAGDEQEPAGELEAEAAGVYAGPGARRQARELGVDLAAVSGSGRKGRITRQDVAAAATPPGPPPAASDNGAPPAGAGLPPWPTVDFARYGPIETVELSRIRRIAGPNLARNWLAIPHVTQHDEADITELEAFRKEVNAAHEDSGVKVTMVSLLLKASAAALRAFPEFNSSLDGSALVLKRYYHVGFAVDTPQGLMVPVIRDVDRRGLLEIAGELAELSGAAREGRLSSDQMRGGTFTISSLGGIGGTAFTPIINAPEVAILGVSRSAMKPVWLDGEFRPRLVLPLSLSYDHRVIDGAAAARFTTHLGRLLADPRRMLL